MAHFAEISKDNLVLRVLVVPKDYEARGAAFLREDLGLGGHWVQTSYSGAIRLRFAGVGMVWDAVRDAFVLPQPWASWVLDATGNWQPPVPRPDGDGWTWDENAAAWAYDATANF